jgi:radical SAM protein with 4Fe4S-binding SPASM domain
LVSITKIDRKHFKTVATDSLKVSRFLAKTGVDPEEILARELGEPFRSYRHNWEKARNFVKIPPFPLHVDYELMSKCNLNCPMCLMSQREEGSVKEFLSKKLDLKVVKALIYEGAKEGQAALGFGGLWEPLLSKDIPEIVSYGKENGLVDLMFNTNGTLLNPIVASDLIKAGLTRIMVSLDAVTKETYALMRPGGDLEEVEENILKFLDLRGKRKLPLVRLSFCLTILNESELVPFLEKWENKVDFFSIQYYGNFSPNTLGFFPENPIFAPPSGRCAQPFKRLLIRHDGTVLPCCDLSALAFKVGDIYKDSLKSIWEGLPMRGLRDALEQEKSSFPILCQKCKSKYNRN